MSSLQSKEQEQKDNEEYSKNFTRIPNMLFISYKHLTKEEKFLYCTLKSVYWDAKPRYVSLRELSDMTGYSTGALSKMIPRLHTCALVHAEIRREKDKHGNEIGNAKFNIIILDIWELNKRYFSCSPNERDLLDPSLKLVHEMNEPVQQMNKPVHEKRQDRSRNEQVCAQPKLTKESKKTSLKTTQKEGESIPIQEIHSFTPSELLLLEWIEGKNIIVAKSEIAVKAQLEKLAHIAKTNGELQSVIEIAQQLYPNINDLSLGNLVNKRVLNAHAQQRAKNAPSQQPENEPKPTTKGPGATQEPMSDATKRDVEGYAEEWGYMRGDAVPRVLAIYQDVNLSDDDFYAYMIEAYKRATDMEGFIELLCEMLGIRKHEAIGA